MFLLTYKLLAFYRYVFYLSLWLCCSMNIDETLYTTYPLSDSTSLIDIGLMFDITFLQRREIIDDDFVYQGMTIPHLAYNTKQTMMLYVYPEIEIVAFKEYKLRLLKVNQLQTFTFIYILLMF